MRAGGRHIPLVRLSLGWTAAPRLDTHGHPSTWEPDLDTAVVLTDEHTGEELAHYSLVGGGRHTAQVMVKLHRSGPAWQLTALGTPIMGRSFPYGSHRFVGRAVSTPPTMARTEELAAATTMPNAMPPVAPALGMAPSTGPCFLARSVRREIGPVAAFKDVTIVEGLPKTR